LKDPLDLLGPVGAKVFAGRVQGQGLDELVIGAVGEGDGKEADAEFPALGREAVLEPLFLLPVASLVASVDDPVGEEDDDLAGLLPAVAL
jgi:hypothetical protein